MSKKVINKTFNENLPRIRTITSDTFKKVKQSNDSTLTSKRILALSMRPQSLNDLIGQDEIVNSLKEQFQSGRIPHFYIISGTIGAGKTTLARILAAMLQNKNKIDTDMNKSNSRDNYRCYDIQEINAANKNGIDDIRSLTSLMKFKPVPPSTAKVVILDEAHQLTNAAQNALITETEDVADHVYYIFCTSAIGKIIPALKRRAFHITPKSLTEETISELLKKAHYFVTQESLTDMTKYIELIKILKENEITSPGLILQAMERFLSGIPAKESVVLSEVSKLDIMAICRTVSAGKWSDCVNYLKDVTKGDIYALRSSILGYLKVILLKSTGTKARNLSLAIKILTEINLEDSIIVPSFLANLFLACEHLAPKISTSAAVKNKIN